MKQNPKIKSIDNSQHIDEHYPGTSVRDWSEDFEEKGIYTNVCYCCKNIFFGHKMRRVCKSCSETTN